MAISTRLQVDRIRPSMNPAWRFSSPRASETALVSNARRSRTSTGALLWFKPVIENFIWSEPPSQAGVRGPSRRGTAQNGDGHERGLAAPPARRSAQKHHHQIEAPGDE